MPILSLSRWQLKISMICNPWGFHSLIASPLNGVVCSTICIMKMQAVRLICKKTTALVSHYIVRNWLYFERVELNGWL